MLYIVVQLDRNDPSRLSKVASFTKRVNEPVPSKKDPKIAVAGNVRDGDRMDDGATRRVDEEDGSRVR